MLTPLAQRLHWAEFQLTNVFSNPFRSHVDFCRVVCLQTFYSNLVATSRCWNSLENLQRFSLCRRRWWMNFYVWVCAESFEMLKKSWEQWKRFVLLKGWCWCSSNMFSPGADLTCSYLMFIFAHTTYGGNQSSRQSDLFPSADLKLCGCYRFKPLSWSSCLLPDQWSWLFCYYFVCFYLELKDAGWDTRLWHLYPV